jgi:hypothetical protein
MFGLSKKETWVRALAYYIIDGELYKFSKGTLLIGDDMNLTDTEIFNKYGVIVRKYRLDYEDFEYWTSDEYNSLEDVPFDMSKAQDVTSYGLEWAIEYIKNSLKNKFYDFRLDETLYSSVDEDLYEEQCFPVILKPRAKLINNSAKKVCESLILEVEVLDGHSGNTRHEFIHFYKFMTSYKPGCSVEVAESDCPYPFKIENYFECVDFLEEPCPF